MAQTCPICNGTGKVHHSKYPDLEESTDAAQYVICRGCSGTGIIYVPTTYPPYIPPIVPVEPYHPHPWQKYPREKWYWDTHTQV